HYLILSTLIVHFLLTIYSFTSFEASVFIRLLERIGKWLAYALILFSILLFLVYRSEKKRIERKQQSMEIANDISTTNTIK
ncbi:hypothetical protein AAEZ63_12700, partial [Myroides sp. C2723]